MASHTSVIVNHRVALPGTSAHGSIATHRLDYVRTREGAVREPTDDDLARQQQQGRIDALGYISHRQGAVLDQDANCALFDQSGIADYRLAKESLAGAKGAILTSVVTVRREDAEELRLQTKQDFERFLRANWSAHLEQMGVAEPQDVRWVAAFHTNSDRNFHVHVISWDESGRFDSLIPKSDLEASRRALVSAAESPARQVANKVRTQARDDLAHAMREGGLDDRFARKADKIIEQLPGQGSLKYAAISKHCPQLREQIDSLVEQRIKASPELREKARAYMEAASRHADLKGLTGARREAFLASAKDDLRSRLGNAQIGALKARAGIAEAVGARPAKDVDTKSVNVPSPRERRRIGVISQEVASCLTEAEREEVINCAKQGIAPSKKTAERVVSLPSVKQAARDSEVLQRSMRAEIRQQITSGAMNAAWMVDSDTGGTGGDFGDESARKALTLGRKAARKIAVAIHEGVKAAQLSKAADAPEKLTQTTTNTLRR